jgi:hypothetical protein
MAETKKTVINDVATQQDTPTGGATQQYRVTAARLNVREAPDKEAGVLRIISKGDVVTGERKGGYVALADGGYTATKFVELIK